VSAVSSPGPAEGGLSRWGAVPEQQAALRESLEAGQRRSLPLEDWEQALAALDSAEERGAPHPELVALSAEVIRTRNTLALHRLAAGVALPAEALRDERLLSEPDDTAHELS
jgi:hypothetical protein